MLRFFDIFCVCFDFCNGLLIGWWLCQIDEECQQLPQKEKELSDMAKLSFNYPRIRVPKKLILLYYLIALLLFGSLSLYLAINR
jgi:hypothetical protein